MKWRDLFSSRDLYIAIIAGLLASTITLAIKTAFGG